MRRRKVPSVKAKQTFQFLQRRGFIPSELDISRESEIYKSSEKVLRHFKTTQSKIKTHKQNELDFKISSSKVTIYYGKVNQNDEPCDQQGLAIFDEGDFYIGQYFKGKMHGKGKLTKIDLQTDTVLFSYEGQWQSGIPHGDGKQLMNNGQLQYQGHFSNGLKEGKGTLLFSDGSVYEGDFKQGQISGYGKMENSSKTSIFEGTWKNGYLQGQGSHTVIKKKFKRIDKYIGEFQEGFKHGKGVYHWGDKKSYQGSFKNGYLHGSGFLQIGNKVYEGQWDKGEQNSLKPQGDMQDLRKTGVQMSVIRMTQKKQEQGSSCQKITTDD